MPSIYIMVLNNKRQSIDGVVASILAVRALEWISRLDCVLKEANYVMVGGTF